MTEAVDSKPRTDVGFYRRERGLVVHQVAQERGIPSKVVASGGQEYTDLSGVKKILPEYAIIISLQISEGTDMHGFWDRVNQLNDRDLRPGFSRDLGAIKAVEKAGKELGPGYMLDPEKDAALAVADDAAHPLREVRRQSSPRVEFAAEAWE